jgi:ATP-dependent Clp protease ATP-binding subunit ClpB
MDGIVRIQLARLAKRLEPRKIELDLDEAAMTWIADRGYDPVYGARPLKRVIQKALQDPLAELLLAGAIKDGDSLKVGADRDGLLIGDSANDAAQDAPATVH